MRGHGLVALDLDDREDGARPRLGLLRQHNLHLSVRDHRNERRERRVVGAHGVVGGAQQQRWAVEAGGEQCGILCGVGCCRDLDHVGHDAIDLVRGHGGRGDPLRLGRRRGCGGRTGRGEQLTGAARERERADQHDRHGDERARGAATTTERRDRGSRPGGLGRSRGDPACSFGCTRQLRLLASGTPVLAAHVVDRPEQERETEQQHGCAGDDDGHRPRRRVVERPS